MWRARARADRDEGRDDERRWGVGSRRAREGDSRRLRGESRRARRVADRPLPPARAGSAHALAHVGPRACAARRRRSRPQDRPLERQPPTARRGTRARSRGRRPGRPQPIRRPRATRGRRRPVRGGRDPGDRALASRRSGSRGARWPGRGARPRRRDEKRDSRRGGACVAARSLAGCRADPGRAPAGDCALRRPGSNARPRR